MPDAEFRFYEELNDFLPPGHRKVAFRATFFGRPTVKDTIEASGVPHTEVDLILVDGVSVGFDHHLSGGERVAVYPVFEGIEIGPLTRLRPQPLRRPRFLVDANLGRLAGFLRLLGFDCLHDPQMHDKELALLAQAEKLIILTRDRGLLMRRIVDRGYFVRSQNPRIQAVEVIRRLDLRDRIRPFTRCATCNGSIEPVSKEEILHRLAPKTRRSYDTFHRCSECSKVYWRGAHWKKLTEIVDQIVSAASV